MLKKSHYHHSRQSPKTKRKPQWHQKEYSKKRDMPRLTLGDPDTSLCVILSYKMTKLKRK